MCATYCLDMLGRKVGKKEAMQETYMSIAEHCTRISFALNTPGHQVLVMQSVSLSD